MLFLSVKQDAVLRQAAFLSTILLSMIQEYRLIACNPEFRATKTSFAPRMAAWFYPVQNRKRVLFHIYSVNNGDIAALVASSGFHIGTTGLTLRMWMA